MNSDKIERLQRASAMKAPEVSRSTETLRPSCALTLKQKTNVSHYTVQLGEIWQFTT